MKRPRGICAAAKAQRAVNKQAGCCSRINPGSFASLLIAMWTNKEHVLFFFSFLFFPPSAPTLFRADVLSFQAARVNEGVRSDSIWAVRSLCFFSFACRSQGLNYRCSGRCFDSSLLAKNASQMLSLIPIRQHFGRFYQARAHTKPR